MQPARIIAEEVCTLNKSRDKLILLFSSVNFPVVAGGTALLLGAVVSPVAVAPAVIAPLVAPLGGAMGLLLAGTAGVGVLGKGM